MAGFLRRHSSETKTKDDFSEKGRFLGLSRVRSCASAPGFFRRAGVLGTVLCLFFGFLPTFSVGKAAGVADLPVYRVKVENLTFAQPLSAPLAIASSSSIPFFPQSGIAPAWLEILAEDGDADAALQAIPDFRRVDGVTIAPTAIRPASSVSFDVYAPAGSSFFLASKLLCTNDGFVSLDHVALPEAGTVVYDARAYDAGTERNTGKSTDIPDECSALSTAPLVGGSDGNENAGVDERRLSSCLGDLCLDIPLGNPIVSHGSLPSDGDLSVLHAWRDPAAKVTITRLLDTSAFRAALTTEGGMRHLQAFQAIAELHGGNRASGRPGYDASTMYIAQQLRAAGYEVSFDEFHFLHFLEIAPPVLSQINPHEIDYISGKDHVVLEYSGSGDLEAKVRAVDLVLPPSPDPSSTSGCEAEDFAGFVPGEIALVQRGGCTFALKGENAVAAGAAGVIIFNEGQKGRREIFHGTLGGIVVDKPVLATSFATGEALAGTGDPVTVRMHVQTTAENQVTHNVIADTAGGDPERVVVIGGHLDSVPEGPGINDNGSGAALVLELALVMAELDITPRNKVRFAFWGAEEGGLIGSQHYVSSLSRQERAKIDVNLNFDMVASPNYARFVYDGDGSLHGSSPGPVGSEAVEAVFLDYFAGIASLPVTQTFFSGRSDYASFTAKDIPAGGLFTGAEGLKTAEEAALYGGEEGESYDACYHKQCDGISNVNEKVFGEIIDAAGHALLVFAMTDVSVSQTISPVPFAAMPDNAENAKMQGFASSARQLAGSREDNAAEGPLPTR